LKKKRRNKKEKRRMTEMTLEMAYARVEELEEQMANVMKSLGMTPKSVEAAKEEKKAEKKAEKKSEKKAEKKKRVMTGYLLYAKEMRPIVKEELIEGGNENPKPTEVITEVAKRWKGLIESEQVKWNERAKTIEDEE
jgi:hypothetical protein